MELVLASTSRYRRELLERLGVSFQSAAPPVDEDAYKRPGIDPAELARDLAVAKASSLSHRFPRAAIIGCDQVAICAGTLLNKPGTAERAVEQLLWLSGRTHELVTALCVWHAGQLYEHTDHTRLTMRPLDRAAVERYVAADQPYDCAGSYKLECRGIGLFASIDTRDPSAITGLPLVALARILVELGWQIP
jgi:septum formation protein